MRSADCTPACAPSCAEGPELPRLPGAVMAPGRTRRVPRLLVLRRVVDVPQGREVERPETYLSSDSPQGLLLPGRVVFGKNEFSDEPSDGRHGEDFLHPLLGEPLRAFLHDLLLEALLGHLRTLPDCAFGRAGLGDGHFLGDDIVGIDADHIRDGSSRLTEPRFPDPLNVELLLKFGSNR